MYSKIMALLWERWRRTRWAVIAACLLPVFGRLLYVAGYVVDYAMLANIDIVVISTFLGFPFLIFALLTGHGESWYVDLAFPKRLFKFPVRTSILISVYMAYGIAVVALPFLILFGIEKLFFDSISFGWSTLLILETVYFSLQALSWLGGPARFLCLALSLAFLYALRFVAGRFNLHMNTNILCSIIILLCCTVSLWSVSAYRHGAWLNGWQWLDSFFNMFRKRPSRRFASPLQAQIWYESRQTGYLFPIAALCLIGLLLGYVAGLAIYEKKFIGMLPQVPIVLQATILAALFAGFLVLAVYHRDRVSGASMFWLRRPMSTQALAVARLYAMARSLVCVIAILIGVILATFAHDYLVFEMSDVMELSPAVSPVKWALRYSSPLETITMTVLGLYGFILFYWIVLWLGPQLLIALSVWGLTMGIGEIALSWYINILIVGLPLGVLGAFYIARRRKLVTTATLVISACLFPVVVISLWAYPWFNLPIELPKGLPDLNQIQIFFLISAATLPFIPVVATPLLMDRLRHR